MITLQEHLCLARIKVLQENLTPQPPDWSLDQDVRRYNAEVEAIHRLMGLAEREAMQTYTQSLITPSRRKKDPK